jgi:hypothetical protein
MSPEYRIPGFVSPSREDVLRDLQLPPQRGKTSIARPGEVSISSARHFAALGVGLGVYVAFIAMLK